MTIFGDFQLTKKLGQGAMATVYKARQISFNRKVALKMLHKTIAENPKLVERFYREARVMGQLDHPNIVQGYSVGDVDGVHYFAMEYVSGVTLQQTLSKLGRLHVGDAVFTALACARALQYAHEHGLIHRDVKPENVLITKRGVVKLADLGMVKKLDEDMSLTQTGHAVGTPWYMPLEQARNAKDVDGRCDIYALGCTFYCMITGKPPFTGANIVEVIQRKELGTFPPARQFNPEVPDRLDLIIAKMTAKLPKHRYAECGELIDDLEALGLAPAKLSFHKTSTEVQSDSDTNLADSQSADTPVPEDIWYVRRKQPEGGVFVEEFSTAEVIELVRAGELVPSIKVCQTLRGGFRALATYKEFREVALEQAVRNGANRKTERYRDLYRQIDEQDIKRTEDRIASNEADKIIVNTMRSGVIISLTIIGALFQFGIVWILVQTFLP